MHNESSSKEPHHIGFTGTRKGMTPEQRSIFRTFMLRIALGEYSELFFHHGDCLGADAEAHALVREFTPHIKIVIHPPTDPTYRASMKGDIEHSTAPYRERNHDIVDACEILIAAPKGEEIQRSGTWATVRYARSKNKMVWLAWPDGHFTIENLEEDLRVTAFV